MVDNTDDISIWIDPPGAELVSGRLKEYLPKSKHGCIVFTSRDKQTGVKLAGQNIIEVPEMDEGGALQLLRNSLVEPSLLDI